MSGNYFPPGYSRQFAFAWGTLLGMGRDLQPKMKDLSLGQEACLSGLPPNTNLWWLGTALLGDPRLLFLPTLFERRESY